MMVNIGDRIREERIKKNFTQQNIADELYVTRQCVSKWEQGKTIPDDESLEKICKILDIEYDELIDTNTFKKMTISEFIKNRKRSYWLYSSLAIVTTAIIITIFLVIFSLKEPINYESVIDYGYIENINSIDQAGLGKIYLKLDFRNLANNEIVTYITNVDQIDILDQDLHSANWTDLKSNDKIKLTTLRHNNEIILDQITIIDSAIEKELLGLYVSTNNDPYDTVGEIKNDQETVFFMSHDYGQLTIGMFTTFPEADYIIEDYTYEISYAYSMYYDLQLFEHPIYIYLLTSEGSELVDTVDDLNPQITKTYQGSANLNNPDDDWLDHYKVSYTITINPSNIPTYYEIFEYDENNLLVSHAILENFSDFIDYSANENAIRAVFITHTTYGSFDSRKGYEILIGETLYLQLSNTFGIVFNYIFNYN